MDICVAVWALMPLTNNVCRKGSGQGQQNQSLGNIAYGTEIQYPVMIDSGRAEHETAALVTVTHTGHEQKRGVLRIPFVMYLVLQCQRAGDLAGSDQLF